MAIALFQSGSALFKDSLKFLLIILGVLVFFGLIWNIVLRKLRRLKKSPSGKEKIEGEKYILFLP